MANSKTPSQTQPQPFSADQRKGMARLLADTKARIEKEDGEFLYEKDNRVEAETLTKLAKEYGAASLLEKVRRLHKECQEAEEALGELGFACSEYSDTLSLSDEAPEKLRQAVKDAQKAAHRERDRELLKYDKAILKVWAAENAREAREIVEELL